MRPAHLLAAWLCAAVSTSAAAADVQAQKRGEEFYRTACAQCHGTDARGGGPLAQVLTVKPTDLTTMSRRAGEQFPFYEAFKIIEGRTEVGAHGTREMPAWGAILEVESRGFQSPQVASTYAYGRISELLVYLESVQQR